MATRHDHWIGGKADAPAGGAYLPTIDPATRRPGDEVAAGDAADVDRAVAAAAGAQPAWGRASGAERSEALHRVADAVEGGADELMALERACTGKLPGQLRIEVDMSASYFRYYAGIVRTLGGRTIDQGAGTHTYTRLEPYGVVAAITPWNLPLNQACRAVAPALAVGNAVVAKPSELTSTSTLHLARLATVAINAGQVCSATTRLLVEAPAHDEVAARVVEAVARLRPGVDFGPMITEAQYRKVLEHQAAARAAGIVPATGGGAYDEGPAADGLYVRPTVYVGVPPGAAVARDEVFGPVSSRSRSQTRPTPSPGPTTPTTGSSAPCGYGREKGIEALHDYALTKTISLSLD